MLLHCDPGLFSFISVRLLSPYCRKAVKDILVLFLGIAVLFEPAHTEEVI